MLQTFERAQVLLTETTIELRDDPEAIPHDGGRLGRAHQITGQESTSGEPESSQIGSDHLAGSLRLLTAELGQPRVGGLSLGQPQDVPLGLTMPDEVDPHGLQSPLRSPFPRRCDAADQGKET